MDAIALLAHTAVNQTDAGPSPQGDELQTPLSLRGLQTQPIEDTSNWDDSVSNSAGIILTIQISNNICFYCNYFYLYNGRSSVS